MVKELTSGPLEYTDNATVHIHSFCDFVIHTLAYHNICPFCNRRPINFIRSLSMGEEILGILTDIFLRFGPKFKGHLIDMADKANA